jgi:beta-lactamase regulating signal transducer with metallopeptidase domain
MQAIESLVLWNATIVVGLALAIWLINRLRWLRERPGLRQGLWLLVLLKMIAPPLVGVPVLPSPAIDTAPESTSMGADSRSTDRVRSPRKRSSSDSATDVGRLGDRFSWPIFLAVLSGAGTCYLVIRSLRLARKLRRALERGEPADARLQRLAEDCSRRMGADRAPELVLVRASISPFLWMRSGRPIVVLPKRLIEEFPVEHLACVVSHEIAHIVRRDHWVNLCSFAIAAVCWWHPIVWWARRELRNCQELCCDSLVIQSLQGAGVATARRRYAETLLKTLEFADGVFPRLPELASAFSTKTFIQGRFEMIGNQRMTHRLSGRAWLVLFGCAALLPCLPVVAATSAAQSTQAPAAVSRTVQLESQAGTISSMTLGAGDIYDLQVLLDGRRYDMRIAANGKLLRKGLDDDENDADDDDRGEKQSADDDEDDDSRSAKDDDDEDEVGDDDEEGDDDDEDGDDDDESMKKPTKGAKGDAKARTKARKVAKEGEDGNDDDDGDDDAKPRSKSDEDEDDDEEQEVAVSLSQLPKAVRLTLKRESAGGEIEEIERVTTRGRVIYEASVEYESDDEEDGEERVYEITISKSGVLISKILEEDEDEDDEEGEDESDDDDQDDDEDDEDEERAERD